MDAGKKIAVVGGGLGGVAAALYISRQFPGCPIHLFERGASLGGRVESIQLENGVVELGSNYFLEDNKLVVELAQSLGLPLQPAMDDNFTLALHNGSQVVTSGTRNSLIFKSVFRYGTSLARLYKHLQGQRGVSNNMYPRLAPGSPNPYENVAQLAGVFAGNYNATAHAFFQNNKFDNSLNNELIRGAVRAAYSTELENINCAAANMALFSTVAKPYCVAGGNASLVNRAANTIGNLVLRLNTQVTQLARQGHDHRLAFTVNGAPGQELFKAVVIATPLEISQIQLAYPEVHAPPHVGATSCFVTYVSGTLQQHFGGSSPANSILFTQGSEARFPGLTCIQRYQPTGNGFLFRVQSSQLIPEHVFPQIFTNFQILGYKGWDFAFADMRPVPAPQLPNFRLADGLYYLNGVEKLASAMEMSCIAARNVANLMLKYDRPKLA